MKIYSTQNRSPLELPSAQFPAEGLTINLSQVNCMELAIDRMTEKGKKQWVPQSSNVFPFLLLTTSKLYKHSHNRSPTGTEKTRKDKENVKN